MHTHRFTLPNGIRVVLVPATDTAAVTVLAYYEVGSRYETDALAGASHFIEHMCFKGTQRRPTTLDISRALDAVGADYNAFTGKDHTGFYVKLQADQLPLAVDLLEDMIYRSPFRQADLDSERQVIVEEIRMYEDNPMMSVDEIMESELYRGSTLGRRIGGTAETLARITRKKLLEYRDAYYCPERTVLTVAGRFDETQVRELLTAKFGGKKALGRARPFRAFDAAKAGYRAPRTLIQTRDSEQVQLALGFPSYRLTDPRLASLSVMSIILGGNMSSRLFTEVREKRGLCYSVHSGSSPYQDIGGLTVQAGLAKDRVAEALKVIIAELKKLKNEDVPTEELARAKEFAKGKTVLALEESSHVADFYGRQELLARRQETPEQKIARLFAVTAADVRRAARETCRAARASLALIGPIKDAKPFAKILAKI